MKVISLFDGISCGQVALNRAGIKVDQYVAFEIEASAIKITQANFPDTVQGGDVTKADFTQYPADLIIGGSPCQFWRSCWPRSRNYSRRSGLVALPAVHPRQERKRRSLVPLREQRLYPPEHQGRHQRSSGCPADRDQLRAGLRPEPPSLLLDEHSQRGAASRPWDLVVVRTGTRHG